MNLRDIVAAVVVVVVVVFYLNISTPGSRHLRNLTQESGDRAAESSACWMHKESGKGDGYVRVGVCVSLKGEKTESALARNKQHSHAVALLLPSQPSSKARSVCR